MGFTTKCLGICEGDIDYVADLCEDAVEEVKNAIEKLGGDVRDLNDFSLLESTAGYLGGTVFLDGITSNIIDAMLSSTVETLKNTELSKFDIEIEYSVNGLASSIDFRDNTDYCCNDIEDALMEDLRNKVLDMIDECGDKFDINEYNFDQLAECYRYGELSETIRDDVDWSISEDDKEDLYD